MENICDLCSKDLALHLSAKEVRDAARQALLMLEIISQDLGKKNESTKLLDDVIGNLKAAVMRSYTKDVIAEYIHGKEWLGA